MIVGARPPVAVERDGMDDGPGGELAGGRDDRLAERNGRLADGRELDRVAAGALDRAADAGRHPQRQVGGVHDGVDLEVADVAVPEFDPSQGSSTDASVRTPTGPAAASYTRGRRRDSRGHDLPRVRGAGPRQVRRRDPLVALRAEQDELVVDADRRPGHVGDVDHDRVHRDVADERHADAADERLGAVRERARPAVAVAERQRRDPARPAGLERRAVRDPVPGRQVRDADRAGVERHHRAEPARPPGGERRRVELVGRRGRRSSGPGRTASYAGNAVERAGRALAARCRRGTSIPGRGERRERGLEARDLGGRPWRVLRRLEVRPDAREAGAARVAAIDAAAATASVERDAAPPEPGLDLELDLELGGRRPRCRAPTAREQRREQRRVAGRDGDRRAPRPRRPAPAGSDRAP